MYYNYSYTYTTYTLYTFFMYHIPPPLPHCWWAVGDDDEDDFHERLHLDLMSYDEEYEGE